VTSWPKMRCQMSSRSRLNGSTALAFTVENGQGSTTPTGTLIAQLPLNY
ncbi:hypothetical protein RBA18_16850, partial [Mycobacteroides abscessus subsp. massiliense]